MSSINIHNVTVQKWSTVILSNYDTKVEKFVNLMSSRTSNDLHFDSINKTISCGNCILNLQKLLVNSNKTYFNPNRKINSNINHLATCIKEKLHAKAQKVLKLDCSNTPKPSSKSNHSLMNPIRNGKENRHPPGYLDLMELEPISKKRARDEPEIQFIKKTCKRESQEDLNSWLRHACWQGNLDECKKFIEQGANVNAKSLFGSTPLIEALESQSTDVVNLLLEHKANVNFPNIYGETPLIIAVKNDNEKICKILLDNGADVNVQDISTSTALMHAVSVNSIPLLDTLIFHPPINLNLKNKFGETALIIAISKDKIAVARRLIDRGTDLNISDEKGWSPLLWAINKNCQPIFNLLISSQVNLNQTCSKGDSPLIYAALKNVRMFKALVDKGADIQARYDGRSILDFIKELRPQKYREIAGILKDKSPSLNRHYKAFEAMLRVAHAWDIEGNGIIEDAEKSFSFKLEGSFVKFWLHKISKNLAQFCEENPGSLRNEKLFYGALVDEAASIEKATTSKKLERIKKGLPTFVSASFKGHAVLLLFWKNQVIICNRGSASTMPIEAYHFDPDLLTIQHLESLDALKHKSKEEYKQLISHLKELLNFHAHRIDIYLEKLGEESLSMQSVGNCSWTTLMAGFFALLMLNVINEENEEFKPSEDVSKSLKQKMKEQRKTYWDWETFQKVYSLDRLLKLIDKTDKQNLEFIETIMAIAKCSEDSILVEQVETLILSHNISGIDVESSIIQDSVKTITN